MRFNFEFKYFLCHCEGVELEELDGKGLSNNLNGVGVQEIINSTRQSQNSFLKQKLPKVNQVFDCL